MIARIVLLLFAFFVPNVLSAGNDPADKRIARRVQKLWNQTGIEYNPLNLEKNSGTGGKFHSINYQQQVLGYLYTGKVFTCSVNGCEKPDPENDNREYFEFFVIFDENKSVLYIEITNYAASHGHEVSSPGWLKQFRGLKTGQVLRYGKEIDGITGATKSAQSLTDEINLLLNSIEAL